MKNKFVLTLCSLLLLLAPPNAFSADVIVSGTIKISAGGGLIFPDNTVQYSATVQGPKGDKGDKGDTGPAGPPGANCISYTLLNYYALGDSITAGAGTSTGNSYADILNANLGFKTFTKLGVPGATAMPYPGRHELADQVNSIGANADVITVLIGVNDFILGNPVGDVNAVLAKSYAILDKTLSFSEAFRYCLETIKRNHEQSRIYVILPLQTTRSGSNPLDQYRTAEIEIANFLAIPVSYANSESGLWSGGTVFPDGLHPNDTGHNMLANYLARKISSL